MKATTNSVEQMKKAFEDDHFGYEFPSAGHRSAALNNFSAGWFAALASAQPEQQPGNSLLERIHDAWVNYERMGPTCEFENQPMTYASVLGEIHSLAAAAPSPQQEGMTDVELGAAMWRMFEHGKNNLRLCAKEEVRELLSRSKEAQPNLIDFHNGDAAIFPKDMGLQDEWNAQPEEWVVQHNGKSVVAATLFKAMTAAQSLRTEEEAAIANANLMHAIDEELAQPGDFAIALHSDGTETDLLAVQPEAAQPAPSTAVPEEVIETLKRVIEWINTLPIPTTGATAKMMLLDQIVKNLKAAPSGDAKDDQEVADQQDAAKAVPVYAVAVRNAALEEAVNACEAEKLVDNLGGEDAAYNLAIEHCVTSIRALQSSAPVAQQEGAQP